MAGAGLCVSRVCFSRQVQYFVTPSSVEVSLSGAAFQAVAGRFGPFRGAPRGVLRSRVLRALPIPDLGWGAQCRVRTLVGLGRAMQRADPGWGAQCTGRLCGGSWSGRAAYLASVWS